MMDKDRIAEAREFAERVPLGRPLARELDRAIGTIRGLADALESRSRAYTDLNADYDALKARTEIEPEWEYRATTDNGAFVGKSRTTPEHAVQALQEAVDEYPIVLDEHGVRVERRPRSPWLPVEGESK